MPDSPEFDERAAHYRALGLAASNARHAEGLFGLPSLSLQMSEDLRARESILARNDPKAHPKALGYRLGDQVLTTTESLLSRPPMRIAVSALRLPHPRSPRRRCQSLA